MKYFRLRAVPRAIHCSAPIGLVLMLISIGQSQEYREREFRPIKPKTTNPFANWTEALEKPMQPLNVPLQVYQTPDRSNLAVSYQGTNPFPALTQSTQAVTGQQAKGAGNIYGYVEPPLPRDEPYSYEPIFEDADKPLPLIPPPPIQQRTAAIEQGKPKPVAVYQKPTSSSPPVKSSVLSNYTKPKLATKSSSTKKWTAPSTSQKSSSSSSWKPKSSSSKGKGLFYRLRSSRSAPSSGSS